MEIQAPAGAHVTATRLKRPACATLIKNIPAYTEAIRLLVAYGSVDVLMRLYRLDTRLSDQDPEGSMAIRDAVANALQTTQMEIETAIQYLQLDAAGNGIELAEPSPSMAVTKIRMEIRSPLGFLYLHLVEHLNLLLANLQSAEQAGFIDKKLLRERTSFWRRQVWNTSHTCIETVDAYATRMGMFCAERKHTWVSRRYSK